MSAPDAIADLEKRIERAYERHSARRVALAAMLVGVLSIGAAWTTYYFCFSVLIATGVFAVCSFLTVNIAMFTIVPPTKKLADSKALMIGALKAPMRIQSQGEKRVKLADRRGSVHVLSGFEQVVWEAIVVPYFIRKSSSAAATPARPVVDPRSAIEKKVLAKQQAELTASAEELVVERKKLGEERIVLEARAKELKKVQDQLENRTSRMEATETDLVRLRENLQRRIRENENVELSGAEDALLQQKAEELQAKELELESVKQQLESDRNQLIEQQANVRQRQGGLADSPSDDALSSKAKQLEARESEIEERLRYVANVENDLIDRLNQLSEREASVEQCEVDAGVRQD